MSSHITLFPDPFNDVPSTGQRLDIPEHTDPQFR